MGKVGMPRLSQDQLRERAKDVLTVIQMYGLVPNSREKVLYSELMNQLVEVVGKGGTNQRIISTMIDKGLITAFTSEDKKRYIAWSTAVIPNVEALFQVLNKVYQDKRREKREWREKQRQLNQEKVENDHLIGDKIIETNQSFNIIELMSNTNSCREEFLKKLTILKKQYESILNADIKIEATIEVRQIDKISL